MKIVFTVCAALTGVAMASTNAIPVEVEEEDSGLIFDAGADLLYPSMTALAEDWENLMRAIKNS